MAKKRGLPNWLPAGWKVEVKTRKKGKKEKWYIEPSKGLKFCSKADVLQYLSSVDSNSSKSSNTKEMEKEGTGKLSAEKAASEGLPPGWIKELKVRRNGRKFRKDPYYIDPVSGQTFRSMKQVSRFLEARESEKVESKPGDQCPGTSELGESSSSLPAEADKQIALDKEVNSNQKLKLGTEHISHSSCVEDGVSSIEGLGGAVPVNKEEEDDGKVVSDTANGEQQEKEDDSKVASDTANGEHQEKEDDGKVVSDPVSGEHQEKEDSKAVSDPISGENQEKPSLDGVEKHDQKTIRRKRKKDMNLPRRASKRLAGIKADPSLKLQTNNQANLATSRQVEETQPANTDKHVATAVTGISVSEMVEDHVISQLKEEREQPTPAKPAKTDLASCEGDKKGETSLESSLTDLWTDPCIEFAIKTLTGTIPVVNEKKADEIPGSNPSKPSVNAPPPEIWEDPCFMFAVKTLTGEIPIEKIVQQQSTSSQFQGNNGLVLPPKANLSHSGAPEKAVCSKQPAVAPKAYQNCLFTKVGSHRPSPLC